MRLDQGVVMVGLIMAGNAWFTAAIVLFTSAVVWRWMKRATGQQLVVDELEFEDEAVVINSPVAGEEPIQRMPGPGNQPPYQMVMGMLSAASSGRRRSVSDICGDGDPLEFISLLSRSNNARTPQARTPVSETDDESEQMSTGHVPGQHAPGETCTVCRPVSPTLEQRNSATPIHRGGMAPFQLAASSRIIPSSSVSCVATLDLPLEGMGEANHTFSTFLVSPRVESIY